MSHDHSAEITTLNTLTATLIDSVNGFENSAKDLDSDQFRQIFRQRADERQQAVELLRTEVRRLGGDPEDGGSTLGNLHQRFEDLKSAITGKDEKAIINEVERGEDYLKGKYDTALADTELSAETQAVIREAYQSVRAGHDRASALKHGMQATSH